MTEAERRRRQQIFQSMAWARTKLNDPTLGDEERALLRAELSAATLDVEAPASRTEPASS